MATIHSFNYLRDPQILDLYVDFTDERVLTKEPALHMRIVFLVSWFFTKVLAFLGLQVALGNKELLGRILNRHLDHLIDNDEARNQDRMTLCENLQEAKNLSFVTSAHRDKITGVQKLAIAAQIAFIERLPDASNLDKCTQLHQLRDKAFTTEEQKAQIDEKIDAFFKDHLIWIQNSNMTFHEKKDLATALALQPFMTDKRAQTLAELPPVIVAAEVARIEHIEPNADAPLAHYHALQALADGTLEPGLFNGVGVAAIQDAKTRVLNAIPKKAMVERDFMKSFFALYAAEVEAFSATPELYNFFISRFAEQFIELLNHNFQVRHHKILSDFNMQISTQFYFGYIKITKEKGEFISAKQTTESFKSFVNQALQRAFVNQALQRAIEKEPKRSLARRTINTYVPLADLDDLHIFNIHNRENMEGFRSIVQYTVESSADNIAVSEFQASLVRIYHIHKDKTGPAEKAELSYWIFKALVENLVNLPRNNEDPTYLENDLVNLFETHKIEFTPVDRAYFSEVVSEALIYRFVTKQADAHDFVALSIEIPLELEKAYHFINTYKMIKKLNPGGDFALFAAALDGLRIYLQTHLHWITKDFNEWFKKPIGLIEADPFGLLSDDHKELWFGEEVFRSFNYDLIKAFNGEQGELQDWMERRADSIMKNPIMHLFRQKLLQGWAGEALLAQAIDNPAELLANDALLKLYGGDVSDFSQDVTTIFKAGVLDTCKAKFDFRKKAFLSIFQKALRGWAGFQFPELDLSQPGVIEQQRIVQENLIQIFPLFFGLDRLMAPVEMDIERSNQVIAKLMHEEARKAERLTLQAIASGELQLN